MVESVDKSHIVGHRGAGNAAPPNTMAALKKAVELGLEWVEFDVHLTSDDQLVVAHEKDLSNLLGENVIVSERTFEDLYDVDLARDFKGARGEEHMPRFEEVLEFCLEHDLRTQIELKANGDDAKTLASAVVATLSQPQYAFPEGKGPLITSFEPESLRAVNAASGSQIDTGLLIHTHENGQWKETAQDTNPTYIHFYGGAFEESIRLPAKFGDDVRAAGYKLNAFKVNTVADARAAIAAGAERFTSDEPEILLGVKDTKPKIGIENKGDVSFDTVVIPVGGYGTRMGEITKAIPKAMLPVGTKPLIMHAVDEALEAGASRIIIPCRPEDVDLFEKQFFGSEGRRSVIQQNKRDELLDEGNAFKDVVEVVPIYAKEGPASTIAQLVKERKIGNFGVILPDDLIVGEQGAMKQMVEKFKGTGMPTIGARRVEDNEKNSNVTFVKMEERDDGASITTTIQIKPGKDDPVSRNGTAGRYIFTSDYVDTVNDIDTEGLKEVSMSAVVRHYAQNGGVGVAELEDVTFYDCGDMGGYMRATAAFIPSDILTQQFLLKNDKVSIMNHDSQKGDMARSANGVDKNKAHLNGDVHDAEHDDLHEDEVIPHMDEDDHEQRTGDTPGPV